MLAEAIKMAKRSPVRSYKTGAVIVDRKGNIISRGWSHATHTRLTTTPYSMHAELHAILRSDRKRLRGATIYIATIRGSKSANITTAKPCPSCGAVLKEVGITNVIYTTKEKV